MIRTAILYLVAALALGLVMQTPAATTTPVLAVVWPVSLHLLVLGWLTQLIFGVAFWMFPRYSADQPRGSEQLAWAAFALLNGGLVIRVFAEPWHTISGMVGALGSWIAFVLLNAGVFSTAVGSLGMPQVVGLLGRSAEGLATLSFALHAWPRVKAFGTPVAS